MKERISTARAAELIGCTVRQLTYQMDKGIWNLGIVSKSRTGRNGRHYVFKAKLEEMLGRELREEELR